MSFLELRNVSKAHGTGPAEVQALQNTTYRPSASARARPGSPPGL